MLKSIVLKNFVHFKDKTVIALYNSQKEQTEEELTKAPLHSNGLNIFVGANFCGKSTVIELIRRCMSDEINVSVTRSWDETKVAYAFCQFEMPQHGEIISGIIKSPENDKMYKVFIYENRTLLRLKMQDSKTTFTCSFENAEDKQTIQSILNKNDDETKYDVVGLFLKNKELRRKESSSNEPNWKSLEEKFIATFPLRGIGSVQWTRSKKIGKKHKARNYKMASERAEILSTLLSREHYRKYINEQDETRIFNFLTYPEVFKFEKVRGEIKVQHNGPQFDLLKTSEGIIEAKVASLLLAHKDIRTLCLEEPDRGMHPQMIERLKSVLYESARHKTIIVVTHSPYFIDSLTINKTRVFIRNRLFDPYVCSVLNVGDNYDLSRVADIETLRVLLFATKVLLVEGASDREIVQTILTNDKCTEPKKSGSSKNTEEGNRDFSIGNISTHQIIPIGGCDNVDKLQSFCDYINVPCLCLLDRDKVIKNEKDKPTFWGKRKDRVAINMIEKINKIRGPEQFDFFEDYMESLQSKLKETTSSRTYAKIREIINFRQKEKRDRDITEYIESLEKKVCPNNFFELRDKPFEEYLRDFESKTRCEMQESEKQDLKKDLKKIANFWHKRKQEKDFNLYIDELNTIEKKKITHSLKEEYLKKLELNRKTFAWRTGDLEDAILSSNSWKISEVLYSTEHETTEDMSEKTANAGHSSKNNDDTNLTATKSEDKKHQRVMTKIELKDKLKERLDDYTRKQLCKFLMDNEEIKNFILFMANEDERNLEEIQPIGCHTPSDSDSGHAVSCLNCFSFCL